MEEDVSRPRPINTGYGYGYGYGYICGTLSLVRLADENPVQVDQFPRFHGGIHLFYCTYIYNILIDLPSDQASRSLFLLFFFFLFFSFLFG